jgi:hypothetical protein
MSVTLSTDDLKSVEQSLQEVLQALEPFRDPTNAGEFLLHPATAQAFREMDQATACDDLHRFTHLNNVVLKMLRRDFRVLSADEKGWRERMRDRQIEIEQATRADIVGQPTLADQDLDDV